ncbi:MAG: hypothetical protein Edafosvirus39_7 [Edafosvirus sp.]|uniref:Aspartic peptidase DDI1-type domain-containing protein n=1 Tax=Edafosvirus sp. TaxID=2487765 RepID=A0A3G4ZWY2_9VIRU|nr:MAG: hypothetical protein Edafosvirus39_7 [Edafosvirus sp.]
MNEVSQALTSVKVVDFLEWAKVAKKKIDMEKYWLLAETNIPGMIFNRSSIHIMIKIGNTDIKCCIDTGAECNIISEALATKLNLPHLLDNTVEGVISGVGESKTIGIIPYIEIKIGDVSYATTFTVMENKLFDMIIGMTFLFYYDAVIDLKKRIINIKGKDVKLIVDYR